MPVGSENEWQGCRGIGGEGEVQECGEGRLGTGVREVRFETAAKCEGAKWEGGI